MPDGIDNVRHLARGLNDYELEERMRKARDDLVQATGEIERSAQELRASVTELHREPRATVELTEDELSYLVEAVDERGFREMRDRPESGAVFDKLRQALAIESQPGGNFWTGGEAA